MIQFNLLPDVKINLIKAKRTNRLITSVAFLAVVVSVILALLMFSLVLSQKKHISDLDKDITKISGELESDPNLTKILTVQNQLKALPALYAGRPAVSRLPAYVDQTTPTNASLTALKINYSDSTYELSGTADTLESVNKYVDTLKFTTYTVGDETETKTNAFSGVVLSSFSKSDDQTTFTIKSTFDPVIFDVTKKVSLVVPKLITTRSQTAAPNSLFTGSTGKQ